LQQVQEKVMAETKERRRSPRKATPKPDVKAAAPRNTAAEEVRRQIEEAAYYRAKQRGFQPGHELEDWVQAESEVMRRNGLR
jgi:hypothetical protein